MRKIILRGNGGKITLKQVGQRGPQGEPGEGVPTGGTTGEVLTKLSNADFDTEWAPVPSAPVDSVNGQTGVVVLDAGDVGADAAGSATQALEDANEYTDEQIDNINTGVVTVAANDSPQGVKDKADFVCTGTNDQTTIAQAFSAASTLARPRVDLAGGQFNISQRIVIPSQGVLRGAGTSATTIFMSNGNTQEAIRALNVSDIEIHDLHIEGNAENRGENTNATVLIQGVDRAHLTNLSIGNVMHHGMEVSYGSTDILIEDCEIDGTRGDGMEIEYAQNVTLNRCKMTNIGHMPFPEDPSNAFEFEFVAQNIRVNDCEFTNVEGGFMLTRAETDSIDVVFNRCVFDESDNQFLRSVGSVSTEGPVARLEFNDCSISNITQNQLAMLHIQSEVHIIMRNCVLRNIYQVLRHFTVDHANSTVEMYNVKGYEVGNFAFAGATESVTLRIVDSHLKFTSSDTDWFPSGDPATVWFHRDGNQDAKRIVDVRGTTLDGSPAIYLYRVYNDDELNISDGTRVINQNLGGNGAGVSAVRIEGSAAGRARVRLGFEISGDIDYAVSASFTFLNTQPPEGTDIAVYNYDFSGVNVRAFLPGDDTALENMNSRFRLGTGFGND